MGLLARSATVIRPARPRAEAAFGDPFLRKGMYTGYYPREWYLGLSHAGVFVTPELSMTLTAIFSGVTRIGGDWMRMPAHVLRVRDDGGKDRIRGGPRAGGIGGLAYRLRWKPNAVQTAASFYACLAAQYVLRSRAYAEIIPDREPIDQVQLVPRHPDRVIEERLPSGRLRFRLLEPNGPDRTLTQEEMLYVHDTSGGGFASLTAAGAGGLSGTAAHPSRIQFGAQAIGAALAAQEAAGRFYSSGMTAALLATHPPGEMDEEAKAALHADLTRFAAGKEHNFGLMLVEEDIKVSALGIDPQKAQMMEARNFGVREVARLLKMPPELLFADNTGTQTGRTWEEIENVYHTGCLGPMVAAFEQAMQDALIVAKDTYIIEFLMDALFRGNLQARGAYYQSALEGPWMWPSEIRVKEGLNPDEALDAIAAKRYRPADPKESTLHVRGHRNERDEADQEARRRATARGSHRYHLVLQDNAVRCLRRERAAVEKLAKKHAQDVEGWQAGLRDFYTDHARIVAETMRLDLETARAYCAHHGTALQAHGVVLLTEHWERREAEELAVLALDASSAVAA